jgi:uncharacterized membrane protein YbhN (UPF0104 family)
LQIGLYGQRVNKSQVGGGALKRRRPVAGAGVSESARAFGEHLKRILPFAGLALTALAAWVLWRNFQHVDLALVLQQLRDYPLPRVLLAVGCVAMAFILGGLYEAIVLRKIGHPLGLARPLLVVAIANPIGHCIGFPALSAGALRYRLYAPLGLSSLRVGAVIALSALPYLLGIGLLLDLALTFDAQQAAPALHLPAAVLMALGIVGLGKDAGYLLFTALRRKKLRLGRLSFHVPSIGFTFIQLMFGLIDITCVAAVLYLFMPPELGLGFAGFIVVYLIAIVAGQVSNVPAGLGVLEAALLLMLPQIPKEKLLAAVVAYRLVFELLPLLTAVGLLTLFELTSRYGAAGRLWRRHSFEKEKSSPARE